MGSLFVKSCHCHHKCPTTNQKLRAAHAVNDIQHLTSCVLEEPHQSQQPNFQIMGTQCLLLFSRGFHTLNETFLWCVRERFESNCLWGCKWPKRSSGRNVAWGVHQRWPNHMKHNLHWGHWFFIQEIKRIKTGTKTLGQTMQCQHSSQWFFWVENNWWTWSHQMGNTWTQQELFSMNTRDFHQCWASSWCGRHSRVYPRPSRPSSACRLLAHLLQ